MLPLGEQTSSRAGGINAFGNVAGSARLSSPQEPVVFLYDGAVHLVPSLGLVNFYDVDINDANVVVGTDAQPDKSKPPNHFSHAFIYYHDVKQTFDIHGSGFIRSGAQAVNNGNQVVGWAHEQWQTTLRQSAMIWTELDKMQKLDDSLLNPFGAWHLSYAADINDQGQIVGLGHILASLEPSYLTLSKTHRHQLLRTCL